MIKFIHHSFTVQRIIKAMIKVCSKESSFLIWDELDTAWVGVFFQLNFV